MLMSYPHQVLEKLAQMVPKNPARERRRPTTSFLAYFGASRTRFPIIQPKDPTRRVTPEMVAEAEEQLFRAEAGDAASPSRG